MIKCPKCYRDIENNEANFCPYCSQPLRGGLENIKKTFNILKILRNIRYSLTKKPVKNKLRVVKINLIIFAIFPIMLIGAIGIRYGAIIVLFQYLLSKKIIIDDEISKVNTVVKISLRTWLISIFVFILSFILSIAVYGNADNLRGLLLEIGNLLAVLYIIISCIKTILGLFIRRKNEKE